MATLLFRVSAFVFSMFPALSLHIPTLGLKPLLMLCSLSSHSVCYSVVLSTHLQFHLILYFSLTSLPVLLLRELWPQRGGGQSSHWHLRSYEHPKGWVMLYTIWDRRKTCAANCHVLEKGEIYEPSLILCWLFHEFSIGVLVAVLFANLGPERFF